MFWNKNRINQNMVQKSFPTSKLALKQMCLTSANGDIEKAGKLYEFMIKDMDDLPIFDPVKPNIIQQIKYEINESFQWLNKNQNQISILFDLFKSKFSKDDKVRSPIPNINKL